MAHIEYLALFVFALCRLSTGCNKVRLESSDRGSILFTKLPELYPGSLGRTSYVSSTDDGLLPIYMYFATMNEHSGNGRWMMSEELGDVKHASAFVDSWAVEPYLVREVNDGADGSAWHVAHLDGYEVDRTMNVVCVDEEGDETVYFESSHLSPALAGFYVATVTPNSLSKVYSHIKLQYTMPDMFLFYHEKRWMIGDTPGADSCLSFVEDEAAVASGIVSKEWRFMNGTNDATSQEDFSWLIDESSVLAKGRISSHGDPAPTVYDALRNHRSLKYVPDKQQYFSLRNDIPIPTMGLGTGGLQGGAETSETFHTALNLGYRLFDLAREYNNEGEFADVLKSLDHEGVVMRHEVFIETKVWPTELGFEPTKNAVFTSLDHLNSNYIDLYLLHWPVCYPHIDWMRCEDTVDPTGTWRESWRALEKMYAEGRIMSIGVSNFDVNLLNELLDFAAIRPHVVQNFAEPGSIDGDVRSWCIDHDVFYQPYASVRNLDNLPTDIRSAIDRIAKEKEVSAHSVVLRSFIQSGSGVIPRSKDINHLAENLAAFGYELSLDEMAELGWPFHTEL